VPASTLSKDSALALGVARSEQSRFASASRKVLDSAKAPQNELIKISGYINLNLRIIFMVIGFLYLVFGK
jgi:hypothetical protein